MDIKNTQVYGLPEGLLRSGYPMLSTVPGCEKFNEIIAQINFDIMNKNYDNQHIKRGIGLSRAGAGHNNWLKSVVVQMDVEAPQYVWMQIERYQFFTIISSQSKMHRLTKMDLGKIPLVGFDVIELVKDNITDYENHIIDIDDLMAEVPMGLELTAGISTNYMCLKNMYNQRKNHRLKFWTDVFCPWVESLPMAKELICGNA